MTHSPGSGLAAAAAPTPVPARTLDGALVRGLVWAGGMKWSSQLLTWVSTLVVARLLTPADYGLVSMAGVYLALITLFAEFGIGAAVVTLRDLTDDQTAQINALSVLFGIAGFAISCAMSGPIGRFFDEPQLPAVVIALSVAFLITAVRTVPYALLQREMRFKLLAIIDGGQAVVGAIAMMVFAAVGLRYWTLVLGVLLSAVLSTAIVVGSRPHRFAWPRRRSLERALAFSWHVLLARFAWYVYTTADLLIAGKLLGRVALGAYSLASTLANVPTDKVGALIANVMPSVFAAVQSDRAAMRRYFLTVTEGMALVTFPLTLGLAFVADDFVLGVLGERWSAIIVPLQLLAIYGTVRSINPPLSQILFVTGESRFAVRNSLMAAALLPPAFWVGTRWGITGVAAAWMIVHPLIVLPQYVRVFRRIELSAAEYLRSLWPAIRGVTLMGLGIVALDQVMPSDWPRLVQLGLQVLVGGLLYGGVVLSLSADRLRAFYRTWKPVGTPP